MVYGNYESFRLGRPGAPHTRWGAADPSLHGGFLVFGKLYQLLKAASTPAPYDLSALQTDVANFLGISPEQQARERALQEKENELLNMEQALELKERERELWKRAEALNNDPST